MWGWALLVDILTGSGAICLVHFAAIASIDNLDLIDINPAFIAGIFKHRHWLATMVNQDFSAFELVPAKCRIGIAAGQEKPVHLIDLCKMNTSWHTALIQGVKALAKGRLNNIGGTVIKRGNGGHARCGNRIFEIQPFFFQKTASHG